MDYFYFFILKNKILKNVCYTELIYDRINKKLGIDLSKKKIEKLITEIIKNIYENSITKIDKNYYLQNIQKIFKLQSTLIFLELLL